MQTRHGEFGGILGKLLVLMVLAAVAAVGWWWFLGRFALPDSEPARPTKVGSVLDYVERRDLGSDPLDEMTRPDPKTGRGGGATDANYVRWFGEYGQTLTLRAAWKILAQGSTIPGIDTADKAREAQLDYLHHAQLAEYYRAKWAASQD